MALAGYDPSDRDPMDVVRAARALLADKKRGRHFELGFESFTEYAASLGHGAAEVRGLLDLARVLHDFTDLLAPVESGAVALEAARALAPVVRDSAALCLPPGAEQPLAVSTARSRWVEAARALPIADLRSEVELAVERARVWPQPIVEVRFELTPDERAQVERVRRLESERHERPISTSELLEIVTRDYLERHGRE